MIAAGILHNSYTAQVWTQTGLKHKTLPGCSRAHGVWMQTSATGDPAGIWCKTEVPSLPFLGRISTPPKTDCDTQHSRQKAHGSANRLLFWTTYYTHTDTHLPYLQSKQCQQVSKEKLALAALPFGQEPRLKVSSAFSSIQLSTTDKEKQRK